MCILQVYSDASPLRLESRLKTPQGTFSIAFAHLGLKKCLNYITSELITNVILVNYN